MNKNPYRTADGERTLYHLLILIRDCRHFTGAPRELIDALAMRAEQDKRTEVERWWSAPDYSVLQKDTLRNIRTLKRAAGELEKSQAVRRFKRPNKSNLFLLDFKLMEQWALEIRAQKKAEEYHNIRPMNPASGPVPRF